MSSGAYLDANVAFGGNAKGLVDAHKVLGAKSAGNVNRRKGAVKGLLLNDLLSYSPLLASAANKGQKTQ